MTMKTTISLPFSPEDVRSGRMTIPDTARREAITQAIAEADAVFGFEIKLIRLVEGESTYRLTMAEGISEHGSYDEAAEIMRDRRDQARADAILAKESEALAELTSGLREVRDTLDAIAGVLTTDRAARGAAANAVKRIDALLAGDKRP